MEIPAFCVLMLNTGMKKYYLILLLICVNLIHAQDSSKVLSGRIRVIGESKGLQGASVKLSGTSLMAISNVKGEYHFRVPYKTVYRLIFSHLSCETILKSITPGQKDTLVVNAELPYKTTLLDTVPIVAIHKPETLIGKPDYSIYDFDFYEDKLLLLTAKKNLKEAQLKLADYQGKIFSTYQLPRQAGEALHFHHDYQGYTELMCRDTVFRLDVIGPEILMMTVAKADFERYLKPVDDSTKGKLYYKNQWDKYPAFNYYAKPILDSLSTLLQTISNNDLLKLYNLEYYYLPSRMQLEARRIADYYKTDKRIVAALLSGFTNSLYYEPLYAPLFVLNDTICLFNHYSNFLYHYNTANTLLDSVPIQYHHPKNWREWKKQLFVDEARNTVYAFFSKDGHHYLKQIDTRSGKEVLTYKLKHHSAEKIKVKDGYVYYVYRPFDSTQERFLYREKIE